MFALPRTTLLGLIMALPLASAEAATWRVTTTADGDDGYCTQQCTLREAVASANRSVGAQVVLLPAGIFTLSLPAPLDPRGAPLDEDDNRHGDLDISGELRIQGAESLASRIQGAGHGRLLEVRPGGRLVLRDLVLEGGHSADNGGAVENYSQLQLRNVLARNNRAMTPDTAGVPLPEAEAFEHGQGGAIANYGDLQVVASHFHDNVASGAFWNNNLGRGGALFNRGSLQVLNSEFNANRVDDQGDRGAGGALYNQGTATVGRSLFTANRTAEMGLGGAIANEAGELLLYNSTLNGNGGALSNGFPGNPALPQARATLMQVTVAGNAGFAVLNWATLLLRNSLVAGNFDLYTDGPANCRNLGPHFTYQAKGLLLNSEASNCRGDLFIDYPQTFQQLLFPLADNGGPTRTHALRPGSLALDAAIGNCSQQDQRGVSRPQDGNGDGVTICDLGAYELFQP
ncbi:MAG: CSLREA domain-containing protein [Pseudomonas sp.]|uniref:choice-of-anchor Q domain-containing protein n=1 Tax=Pseudomonas sp. TaxID=306 RepID=UPI00339928A1